MQCIHWRRDSDCPRRANWKSKRWFTVIPTLTGLLSCNESRDDRTQRSVSIQTHSQIQTASYLFELCKVLMRKVSRHMGIIDEKVSRIKTTCLKWTFEDLRSTNKAFKQAVPYLHEISWRGQSYLPSQSLRRTIALGRGRCQRQKWMQTTLPEDRVVEPKNQMNHPHKLSIPNRERQ